MEHAILSRLGGVHAVEANRTFGITRMMVANPFIGTYHAMIGKDQATLSTQSAVTLPGLASLVCVDTTCMVGSTACGSN